MIKNQEGSALLTTSVLMFAIMILGIVTFATFYNSVAKSKNAYNVSICEIQASVIAQNVIIEVFFNQAPLTDTTMVNVGDNVYMVSKIDENIYEFQVFHESVTLIVRINQETEILNWNISK